MKKGLEIEDIVNYRFISSLCASPDGSNCVFSVHRVDLGKNGYETDLFLYSDMDRKIRRLTEGGCAESECWLDETTLLVSLKSGESKDNDAEKPVTRYAVLDFSDGELKPCFEIPANVRWIKPIGRNKFAVLAKSYLPDMGSPVPKRAERDTWRCVESDYTVADELPFRQDGMGITNGMRFRCFVYDCASNTLVPVTDEYQNIESIDAVDGKIILSARRFRKNEAYLFYGDVEVYDCETDKLDVLMDDHTFRVYGVGFLQGEPYFVGTKGLLHGYQNENASFYRFNKKGEPELFCSNVMSTHNTVGTDMRYGSTSAYLAADKGVYYIGTDCGCAHIKHAGLDGIIQTVSCERGTVDDFALLANGRILCTAMIENRPEEIYILENGKMKLISAFNREVKEIYKTSVPETLLFKSELTEMDGYVIKPVDFDENKKYPGILYIHGGHKCAFGPIYYHEMQVFANRGFFVLYCNPRGSDGRDDDFADVIGHYGFYEEEDLLAFCDACLKEYPQIDAERLGVGGGSYGGFLTNWMIGRTHRFKCAVSQRSIASWNTMFFTSDTNYLFPCWGGENNIWMDQQRYWLHSPLKYVVDCDTPTLFIHSENDYRCPVSEGISMFQALQYLGVESRLCIFHGESHGLCRSGKPRNRIKRLEEITHWFEKYLTPQA